jgi:hypothetical protein
MMLLWACAGVPLGAYNIAGDFNIALQIQPQILTVLSLITWIQCYYYDDVSSPRPLSLKQTKPDGWEKEARANESRNGA